MQNAGHVEYDENAPKGEVYATEYEGLINALKRWFAGGTTDSLREWVEKFMELKTCDTSNGALNVVHTFSEYSAISGMGESDISFDGDHFVFAGDRRYVFVYRISQVQRASGESGKAPLHAALLF